MSVHARPSQHGFSLLEAIVAMVLIAIAGMALFSWINGSFESIGRIESANARAASKLNALEYIKTINPMQRPSGSEKIGALSIRWEARELTTPTPTLGDEGDQGRFLVALYEVTVTVESPPDVPPYRFVLSQMGSSRRSGVDELFGDEPAQPIRK